jgi:hypothetical protein
VYIDDGKRVISWAATAEEARRRPLSAGAARFIELTRLPIRRTDDALGETSSGASTTSRITYASWLLSESIAS